MTKLSIIFYSTYGHVHRLALAEAEGAREVAGCDVSLFRFPEVIADEKLEAMGALDAAKAMRDIPEISAEQLAEADAILFGFPTRYGNYPQQVANLIDRSGGQWASGALIGKLGGVFTSTASQHGGQETTCLSFYTFMIHMGMLVTGVPYSEPGLTKLDEVSGGTPYGATTIAGPDGSRLPSANELAIARAQGRHIATYAVKLAG